MTYTLITSDRSPFGRICRVFMLAHKINFELRLLNFVDSPKDALSLAKETPINKVPILTIDGKQKVFDSRVIINCLIKGHNLKPIDLEEENIISAI